MEVIQTQRGGAALIKDGMKYTIDRRHSQTISWRCSIKSCKARLVTDNEIKEVLRTLHEHQHSALSQQDIDLLKTQTAVKRKAGETTLERPSKIIYREAAKTETLTIQHCKRLSNVFYYTRLKRRPTLPSSREETMTALNNFESNICMNISSESGIVLFCTPQLLQHLCKADHVFADGTFKICPKFFLQVYSFHVWSNGQYCACSFFLLPDKKQSTYTKMLNILLEECSKVGATFNPSYLHLDLEQSMMNVCKSLCPTVTIKACQFHVAQAWYRCISKGGLSTVYKESSDVSKWLKAFFGLPALHSEEVEDAFHFTLMAEAPEIADGDPLDKFLTYLLKEYIQPTSSFPPSIWASQETTLRTNNACESFHRHFSSNFTSPHPNIFVFHDHLSEEINNGIAMKLRSTSLQPTRKRIRERQEKRDTNLQQYKDGTITQMEFLQKLSYSMLPVL